MSRPSGPSHLTVPGRFNGPPTSANGGFTAGLMATALLDAHAGSAGQHGTSSSGEDVPTVQVTLRRPPPLDVALVLSASDGEMTAGDVEGAVAVARRVEATAAGVALDPVDPGTATAAGLRFGGLTDHPFPTCFVCGTRRVEHDGLEVFPGPFTGADGSPVESACAAVYVATRDHTEARVGTGVSGDIGAEIVWALLDCPGGWATGFPGRPAVLGRLTARVPSVPTVGERCVVVGRFDGRERRKSFTRTTAYGADGRELGRASAVWIDLP
ncbi:MAG: hypothetical protein ABJA87_13555 [bacterium]